MTIALRSRPESWAERLLSGPGAHRAARWGVLLLAATVRIWFLTRHPISEDVGSDMSVYQLRAFNLMSGQLGPWDTFTPPGYPAFLAAVFGVAERSLGAVAIVQCALGTLTVLLVHGLAERILRSRALGLVCGLLMALHAPHVYYGAFLLSETLFTFLVMLHVALLLELLKSPNVVYALAAGLAIGAAVTVRPNLALGIPLIPVFLWFAFAKDWARVARYGGCLLIFAIIPIAAAASHNTRVLGQKAGIATNGGLNFYLNLAETQAVSYPEGTFVHHIEPIPNSIRYRGGETVLVPFYNEKYFYQRAFGLIREKPTRLVRALDNFVEATGVARQGYWPHSDAWAPWLRYYSIAFCLVIALALLRCVWLSVRSVRTRHFGDLRIILLILLVSDAIAIYLFLGDPRMRVPMDALLIILAVDFASQIAKRLRARTRHELARVPAPDPSPPPRAEPEHAP